jgi:hypothetical protein
MPSNAGKRLVKTIGGKWESTVGFFIDYKFNRNLNYQNSQWIYSPSRLSTATLADSADHSTAVSLSNCRNPFDPANALQIV